MTDYSLYFHIPFCAHRCAYCDFNTYAGQENSIPAYVEALCQEIQSVGENSERSRSDRQGAVEGRMRVGTIFFGGGTPSLLTAAQFQAIFQAIHAHFDVSPGAEISLEANPGTVSLAGLQALRQVGFNRISYGVQSANPEELRLLERIHSYSDVVDVVRWSRRAGFDNLNLDLIYGLPEQTLASWQRTVQLIVGLRPEHLSAYALTIEHGTPFGRWAAKGLLPIPDPDLAAEQYEWLMEFLAAQGYEQYEISNWSLPGRQCRHNLQYWRNLNYLGLGAGAHGYAHSVRYSNVLRIKTYIDRLHPVSLNTDPLNTASLNTASLNTASLNTASLNTAFPLSPATVNQHANTPREDMQETMLTGLRLTEEGVSAAGFHQRFGLELREVFGKEIGPLEKNGLLTWAGETLRLTERGRLLGNRVFMEFVGE